MTASEPLATGTLLLVDGRQAEADRLDDPDALATMLGEMGRDLEAEAEPLAALVREDDGTSHALLLDEAHLVLHAFPAPAAFSFKAFSRHALTDVELYNRVLTALRTGRFESVLRRRAPGMPRDPEALSRRLAGERAWARARIAPEPNENA